MGKQTSKTSRRQFLKSASGAVAAFAIVPRHVLGQGQTPPSEKLNIACVGVGGRGGANLNGVSGENIVAMCDVDMRKAAEAFKSFPKAEKYHDYRRMLDEQEKNIDAVVVSTPDHTHAVALIDAIKRGKHVYSEKPLAHSIHEVRALRKAAREHKVVTQLGNQGHSFNDIRTFCEWIWDGAIGVVREAHAFCGSNYSRVGDLHKLKERHDVPPEVDWNLWLGPAQWRPYNPMYLPGSWRRWSAFGTGCIGDWVCHTVDPVFWALDLDAPKTIRAEAMGYDPKKHAETFPPGTKVTYEFAAKGRRGPVKLVWFDGDWAPPRPPELEPGREARRTGGVVFGDKGTIMYGSHGAGSPRIIPEAKMRAYKRPEQTLPRVKNHHHDWLSAIKTGGQAGSHFDYGGPLTEIALLGAIGIRFLGQKLEWDAEGMRFTNCPEANAFVSPPYREGWTL
jgi:predicted dehydrogenase